jgi:hypothetical protein
MITEVKILKLKNSHNQRKCPIQMKNQQKMVIKNRPLKVKPPLLQSRWRQN